MATNINLETGGSVWKMHVKPGDTVAEGQELFIMEVMKMEVPYEAPAAGTVSAESVVVNTTTTSQPRHARNLDLAT